MPPIFSDTRRMLRHCMNKSRNRQFNAELTPCTEVLKSKYLPSSSNTCEIIFTLSAETEVKEWKNKVLATGGSISHQPGKDDTQYNGFAFAHPDGHQFNILLMENRM